MTLLLLEALDFLQVQKTIRNMQANRIKPQQTWMSFLVTGQFEIKIKMCHLVKLCLLSIIGKSVLIRTEDQPLFSTTMLEDIFFLKCPHLHCTLRLLDLIRTLWEDGRFHQEDLFSSMTKPTGEGVKIYKISFKWFQCEAVRILWW